MSYTNFYDKLTVTGNAAIGNVTTSDITASVGNITQVNADDVSSDYVRASEIRSKDGSSSFHLYTDSDASYITVSDSLDRIDILSSNTGSIENMEIGYDTPANGYFIEVTASILNANVVVANSIVNPDGSTFTQTYLHGNVVPPNGTGDEGSWFIQTSTNPFSVYQKLNGVWTAQADLPDLISSVTNDSNNNILLGQARDAFFTGIFVESIPLQNALLYALNPANNVEFDSVINRGTNVVTFNLSNLDSTSYNAFLTSQIGTRFTGTAVSNYDGGGNQEWRLDVWNVQGNGTDTIAISFKNDPSEPQYLEILAQTIGSDDQGLIVTNEFCSNYFITSQVLVSANNAGRFVIRNEIDSQWVSSEDIIYNYDANTLVVTNISTANITASSINVATLEVSTINVDTMNASVVNTNDLNSNTGNVTLSTIVVDTIDASVVSADDLNSNTGNVTLSTIVVDTITASIINTNELNSNTGNVTLSTVNVDTVIANTINAISITSEQLSSNDIFVGNVLSFSDGTSTNTATKASGLNGYVQLSDGFKLTSTSKLIYDELLSTLDTQGHYLSYVYNGTGSTSATLRSYKSRGSDGSAVPLEIGDDIFVIRTGGYSGNGATTIGGITGWTDQRLMWANVSNIPEGTNRYASNFHVQTINANNETNVFGFDHDGNFTTANSIIFGDGSVQTKAVTVAGSDGQIQFNNNDILGAVSNVTSDGTSVTFSTVSDIKLNGGSNNQILSTDGNGNLSWVEQLGANANTISAGGVSGDIQFNRNGHLYANSNLSVTLGGDDGVETLNLPTFLKLKPRTGTPPAVVKGVIFFNDEQTELDGRGIYVSINGVVWSRISVI